LASWRQEFGGRDFLRVVAQDMEEKKRKGSSAAAWRTSVLAKHLTQELSYGAFLQPQACLAYAPPEVNSGKIYPSLNSLEVFFMQIPELKSG
jgi:hypothetical protein